MWMMTSLYRSKNHDVSRRYGHDIVVVYKPSAGVPAAQSLAQKIQVALSTPTMRSSLAVLLLLVASARGFYNCRCGAFTTSSIGEIIIYELPGIDIGSCDAHVQCKSRCEKEFNDMSSNGDLNHMVDAFTSVGQYLCQQVDHPVHNEYVYAYFELCNGPWEYTGSRTMQMLCCNSSGEHYQCTSL
ncbi:uncharacterized protein LOC143020038 isoform X2 [Oratosquilla oratoria]|uniref:uncharacterized protein LOC143018249 isoform X2 n=2 Tax=Oratosquilla oratoria TaxID=337810 RepID=UPI003F76EA56